MVPLPLVQRLTRQNTSTYWRTQASDRLSRALFATQSATQLDARPGALPAPTTPGHGRGWGGEPNNARILGGGLPRRDQAEALGSYELNSPGGHLDRLCLRPPEPKRSARPSGRAVTAGLTGRHPGRRFQLPVRRTAGLQDRVEACRGRIPRTNRGQTIKKA
jgi:hypothetical protein